MLVGAAGKKRGTDGRAGSPQRAPFSGVIVSLESLVASSDAFGDPLADFRIAPGDPALAERNPLGKLLGLFEPRYVLRAVGDTDRLELLLRNQQSLDLHRHTPC